MFFRPIKRALTAAVKSCADDEVTSQMMQTGLYYAVAGAMLTVLKTGIQMAVSNEAVSESQFGRTALIFALTGFLIGNVVGLLSSRSNQESRKIEGRAYYNSFNLLDRSSQIINTMENRDVEIVVKSKTTKSQ